MRPGFPLPFERVRWQRRRYAVSDFRLVVLHGATVDGEIALHDIDGIDVEPSLIERLTGVGTLIVRSARGSEPDLRVPWVRAARREALRLELFISEARGLPPDNDVARLPLSSFWSAPAPSRLPVTLVSPVIILVTLIVIGIGLSGHTVPVRYPDDDPIRPRGVKRPRAEVIAFMERKVMPWAREALAPIVGPEDVTCGTCHGPDAEARGWTMPAVDALPEPHVRAMARSAGSDSQVRNALHGYLAGGDNQARAAYMRAVVNPGMARLLRRPMYDFAQTYEFNRSRAAVGCYHCHMVGEP